MFAIRPAVPQDIPAIVRLLETSMGAASSIPRTQEYWEWKHIRNPFGASPVLLAEAEGKLIGLRAFLRWNLRTGIRELKAVRAVDTVTHPEWRGQSVFSTLTLQLLQKMKEERVAFVFNTPNESSLPGYFKMGWNQVTRIPVWIKPLKSAGLIPRLFKPAADSAAVLENAICVTEFLHQDHTPEISAPTRMHGITRRARNLTTGGVTVKFLEFDTMCLKKNKRSSLRISSSGSACASISQS